MRQAKTRLAALALLLGSGLGIGSASASSLSTDLTVNMATVLSLACFEQVDVDLTADNFIAAVGRNGDRPLPSLTRNARAREGQLTVNGSRRQWNSGRYRFRRRVNLDLLDVCAYRALGGIGGARVTIEALGRRLESAGGAHIQVNRVRTRDHENAGAWRRRFRIPAADLGNGDLRGIDVRLRLDLQEATEPGRYSSPTDGTFRITVTPNP